MCPEKRVRVVNNRAERMRMTGLEVARPETRVPDISV
jgi:hypothetical protein